MQLYKVDQFGMVSVIDGSSFNIMTDTRILEEVRKAATVIKSDPSKLQTIEELGGNVEEFVGQYLTGTAAANPLQITVDGQ